MFGIRFPYHENSLDGVFGYGAKKLNIKIAYEARLSSSYVSGYYPAANCFDGNPGTICHTNGNAGKYVHVRFPYSKFKIEGFALQNRADQCHNPLNYVIRVSNDGSTFDNISYFEENQSEVCKGGQIRTHRVKAKAKYSYFRLEMTGVSCNGITRNLNLAEFDLFGSFGEMSMCLQSIKRSNSFFSHVMSFVFMAV